MEEGPDRGRAWLVVFAGFIIHVITVGIYRSHSLLFMSLIHTYHADRKSASLPFSLRMAVRNFVAPIVRIIGQKYNISAVIVSGGILGTFSIAACSFATSLTWITISWGVMYGVAMAMITVLPQIVINQYFTKHRPTATGITLSGSCIGSFIFPAILEYLLNKYDLYGTYLIIAGIILNTVPAAMIIKMPSWWKGDKLINSIAKSCHNGAIILPNQEENDISNARIKNNSCERGIQVGNGLHDNYYDKKITMNHSNPRSRSYSCSALIHQMNNIPRTSTMPSISTNENNSKSFFSCSEIFDIDLDYLKQNSDLLFQMILMEIPNREISYRAILLEVEQDDLWHPDKIEVMQEIESIYCHIEKTLEIDPVSDKKVKANGLYLKKSLLGGALMKTSRSESVRAVKRYFRTYKERGLKLSKIRSAPNFSNIYKELAKKDYVLSKLKQLCNSNEIRIVSHLCHNNPKDVLKVLFQIRTLYRIYNEIETTDAFESHENCDGVETGDILFMKRQSCSQEKALVEPVETAGELQTNFRGHFMTAIKLHGEAIFWLLAVTRAVFFLNFLPVSTTIVDFATDRGFDEEDGKFLILVLSLGDTLGRIGSGWITDRGYTSHSRYMLVSLCILSLCTIAIPLMNTKWMLYISIALFGMFQGSLYIRIPVLVTNYFSPQNQSIAMGCMEFSSGFICLVIPIYIGFFRDVMETYDPIFYINGCILFLLGISWLLEPSIVKRMEISAHENSCKSQEIEIARDKVP